jgi:hypothetical protein
MTTATAPPGKNHLTAQAVVNKAVREITLPHRIIPRDYQVKDLLAPLDNGFLRIVNIWHRRAGKDKAAFNAMVKKAYPEVGNYFYMFPVATEGRKAIWDAIDNDGMKFIDHIPQELLFKKPNDTEMKVTLVHPENPNEPGSTIQIVGGDTYNNVMGSNPRGLVMSEYSLMNPLTWEYMKPIFRVNKGWVIFIYTPRGNNHGKELYDIALANPSTWYSSLLTIDDTGVLTEEDIIQEMSEGMSYEMAQQEYYCSFEAGVPGSYYGRALSQARKENRVIANLPLEPGVPVHTFWDIGVGDATAIWFGQFISNKELRMVDYYENSGEGLPHYHGILQQKALERNMVYGRHFGPHDIVNREFTSGLTRIDTAREMGLDFDVVAKLTVDEGIEMARAVFPKVWFDAKHCKYGLSALENYRKKYNEKTKAYDKKPMHDWSSNGADAFRYMAVAYKTMTVLAKSKANGNKRIGRPVKEYKTSDPFRGSKSRTYQTRRN